MKQFATITVIGRDKTGVIARVTNFLFEQHANIEALEEQVTRGQFSMTLQASWKDGELNPPFNAASRDWPPRCRWKSNCASPIRAPAALGHSGHAGRRIVSTPSCAPAKIGQLKRAEPAVVIGNRRELEPLARQYKLPFVVIPWNERAEAEEKLLEAARGTRNRFCRARAVHENPFAELRLAV